MSENTDLGRGQTWVRPKVHVIALGGHAQAGDVLGDEDGATFEGENLFS